MPSNRNPPAGMYWSPSRHDLAGTCPWCFVRKYVLCEPTPQRDEAYFRYGHLLHSAMEGIDITQMSEDILDKDGFRVLVMAQKHAKLYQQYYSRLRMTDYDVPEYEFNLTLKHPITGEPFPVPFYGIVDRKLYFDNHKARGFVDYKTSRQEWSQRQIDNNRQFTWYWMAFWQEEGFVPDEAFILNFLKDETNPSARARPIERSQQQCVDLFEEATRLYNQCVIHSDSVEQVCKRQFYCPYR